MKKLVLLFTLIVGTAVGAFAQIHTPVKWTFSSKKINATEAVIYLRASIQQGWHIYSQHIADGGPIKTSFTFTPSKEYSVVGKTIEPKPIAKYEESFKMNVGYFMKEVIFQQKVKLKKGTTTVKGSVEWQACDESKCLPPDDFAFAVNVK